MLEALKQIRDNLVNGWRNSSGAERVPYIAVVAGFLILVVAYVAWVSQPTWVFLTRAPNPAYTNRVTKVLDEKAIEYKITEEGVYVRTDKEKFIAQGEIAASGITPGGGQFGWEIFLEPKLGTTGRVLEIQEKAAIRSQVERILSAMDPIDWAMVQIDVPKETLFADSKRAAVASATLDTHGPISLEQVRAIQNIVASADASLSPGNVRVIDTNLNLLSGESLDPLEGITLAQLKVKKSYESQLEQKAVSQLLPILGDGKARVKVDLDLDFQDREIENNEIDPNTLVTIQEDVTTENTVGGSSVAREPGIPANLSGQGAVASGPSGDTTSKETTSTISKVSEKRTVERIIGPKIVRMTVSVVVDGKYGKDGGVAAFEKRSQEELTQIEQIVAQALGYSETRDGTNGITVACAPFESIQPVSAGFGAQAIGLLGNWRALFGPLVLILVPFVAYVIYRKMDRKREAVREEFHKRLQKLVQPGEAGQEDEEDIKFGVDLLKLPEEERRTYKMQQKLVEYARRNPKDFAQVLKAWIRE